MATVSACQNQPKQKRNKPRSLSSRHAERSQMKAILLALFLLTVAVAADAPEARYWPIGNWPLCQVGINADAPCVNYQPGTEPGMVAVRIPAESRATRIAYAVACDGKRVTGEMPRTDFAGGW